MTKDELFGVFKIMFPEWAKTVTSYKKIGSRTLAITFCNGPKDPKYSRVFLYIDKDNWQFGTKLWRKRPDVVNKNSDLSIEELQRRIDYLKSRL